MKTAGTTVKSGSKTIGGKILHRLWATAFKPLAGWLMYRNLPLVIVSGANGSHYKSLRQFIASARRHEPASRLVIYDLGLEAGQLKELDQLFPGLDMRRFPYENYPDYFDITKNAGEFAWKPVIVEQVLVDFSLPTVWMDAGNKIVTPLYALRWELSRRGIYSPASHGTVRQWTHPLTLEWLSVGPEILEYPNRNGAAIAINPESDTALGIARRWAEGARDRRCIAPEGSSRANHRQDQSVFSVLYYTAGFSPACEPLRIGFKTHQDVD